MEVGSTLEILWVKVVNCRKLSSVRDEAEEEEEKEEEKEKEKEEEKEKEKKKTFSLRK